MACVAEFCRPISDQDITINFYCCGLSLLIFQLELATIVAEVIPTKFSVITAVVEQAHNRSFNKARPYKLKWITFYMKTCLATKKIKAFRKNKLKINLNQTLQLLHEFYQPILLSISIIQIGRAL